MEQVVPEISPPREAQFTGENALPRFSFSAFQLFGNGGR
jgi:hypothetical protein